MVRFKNPEMEGFNKMTSRVLIWNAHWRTAGGGERYALMLGEALTRNGMHVTFAAFKQQDIDYSRGFLNIRNFEYESIEINHEHDLISLCSDYDLFINGSYGSSLVAPISNSIYICHFPHYNRRFNFLKRLMNRVETSTAYTLGGKALNPQFNDYLWCDENVYLFLREKEVLNLKCVQNRISVVADNSTSELLSDESLELRGPGFFSVNLRESSPSAFIIEGLRKLNPFVALISRYLPHPFPARSYQKIWANSNFTSKWVQIHWGVPSSVVYPPVQLRKVENFNAGNRGILSVGRFMSPQHNHSKNQHLLVKAFTHLLKQDDGFNLILLGGVSNTQESYFLEIQQSIGNLPIKIFPNALQKDLDKSYKVSTFYWHAAGLKQLKSAPQNMEHFGISIVEAMSSGLIPLVYREGGPAEILSDFPELIYDSVEDLVQKTISLSQIDLEDLRERIILESKKYGDEAFVNRVLQNLD